MAMGAQRGDPCRARRVRRARVSRVALVQGRKGGRNVSRVPAWLEPARSPGVRGDMAFGRFRNALLFAVGSRRRNVDAGGSVASWRAADGGVVRASRGPSVVDASPEYRAPA